MLHPLPSDRLKIEIKAPQGQGGYRRISARRHFARIEDKLTKSIDLLLINHLTIGRTAPAKFDED
jgi:hypothetical protein